MSNASNKKIELTEIADYRGNLSFAEENNPIPFDIKSVFWTTITKDVELNIDTQTFLIVLSGEVTVNNELLDKPNQAFSADKNAILQLRLQSQEAIILIVMNKEIVDKGKSIEHNNNILEMPQTKDFCGLKGYFANSNTTLPFDIKRVYFTYKIPGFAKRGGHAHKKLRSIILPLKGSFDVVTDNNITKQTTPLSIPERGLLLDTGIWRELENFADQSIVLVLASELYSEVDYIRDYDHFKTI